MKKKKNIKSLDFSSEKQTKQKQIRSFIIAFASFVIILGTISVFAFMKSVDFDIKNLVQSTTDTTVGSTEISNTTLTEISGKSNIIIFFSDDSGALSSVSALNCDMDKKCISVFQLSPEYAENGGTLNDAYLKGGALGAKQFISSSSGIKFDKYIKLSPAQLKKIVGKTGDISVNIPEAINYKGSSFSLLLDAGVQNLTSDLFCKYFMYSDLTGKSNAVASLVNSLLSVKNLTSQDSIFNFIMNNSDTDISIVDYTKISGTLSAFIQYTGGNSAVSVGDFSVFSEVTSIEK